MAVVDLSKYDNFFFNCDGVIWYGSQAIPGSGETLRKLHAMGKKVFFVTNNPALSQSDLAEKIKSFGYQCQPSQIYGTAKATGVYLLKRYPHIRKVFVIGQPAYKHELESLGLTVIHSHDFPQARIQSLEHLKSIRPDPEVQAVVVGTQMSFSYLGAYYGAMCVQRGAKLLASTRDSYFILKDGIRMPGCGTMLAFMEAATDQKAEVVGKPTPFFMEWAQESEGIDLSRTLMIGDSMTADIQFAVNVGIHSLLVLSGVTGMGDLSQHTIRPTYILPSLSSLIPH